MWSETPSIVPGTSGPSASPLCLFYPIFFPIIIILPLPLSHSHNQSSPFPPSPPSYSLNYGQSQAMDLSSPFGPKLVSFLSGVHILMDGISNYWALILFFFIITMISFILALTIPDTIQKIYHL